MNAGNKDINILVVGLGSMGKRRIRNLRQLGYKNIYGYDPRPDRAKEAVDLYETIIVADATEALKNTGFGAMIISVPPDLHHTYMELALLFNVHFFVEASVVDDGLEAIKSQLRSNKGLVAAPSATLFFHPAIRHIFSVVKSGELGKVTNFIYHSGQYLPDWHTYEKVSDFYVSKKSTGGAREIVPFELSWITKLLGFPSKVNGIVKKTIDIPGAEDIEDTYNALLDYDGFMLNLVVDVVSRHATRRLLINGSEKQLVWNWEENAIRIYSPSSDEWVSWNYDVKSSAQGYNKNITEQMYMDELINFFDAIDEKNEFFNTIEYDHKVLKLLYTIERSSAEGITQEFLEK